MTNENNSPAVIGFIIGLGANGIALSCMALIVSFIPCFWTWAIAIGIIGFFSGAASLILSIVKNGNKTLGIIAIMISLTVGGFAFYQYWHFKYKMEQFENLHDLDFEELEDNLEDELDY